MLLTLGHHLSAGEVEDVDLEVFGSQHLEGDEVPDMQLVSYEEAGPPFTKGEPTIDHPDCDPPVAAGAHPKNDFRWYCYHMLAEVNGGRQTLQLRCQNDLAEVSWTHKWFSSSFSRHESSSLVK